MKCIFLIVFTVAVLHVNVEAKDVEILYDFRGLPIRLSIPKFFERNGLVSQKVFSSFEETGNVDICSVLWEKRGFLSTQPKERFSFSIMKRPEQLGSLEIEEVKKYITGYLHDRWRGSASVRVREQELAGRRWLRIEISDIQRPTEIISFLNFSPLGDDAILVARVNSIDGEHIRTNLLNNFRESLVTVLESVRVGDNMKGNPTGTLRDK
jgi:hypothetical protein